MLAKAERRVSVALRAAISFVAGDTVRDSTLFSAGSFAAIVSRQVVCHLTDPLAAFCHWHTWLLPDRHVLIVDGSGFALAGVMTNWWMPYHLRVSKPAAPSPTC